MKDSPRAPDGYAGDGVRFKQNYGAMTATMQSSLVGGRASARVGLQPRSAALQDQGLDRRRAGAAEA